MLEFIRKFLEAVLKNRWKVVAAYVVMLVVAAILALQLKVNNAVELLVSSADPRRVHYAEFLKKFGSDEFSIVAIERKSGIFDKEFLKGVERLTTAISKVPHVGDVQTVISKYRRAGRLASIDIVELTWLKNLWYSDDLNVKAGLINKDGTVISIVVPIVQSGKGRAREVVVPELEKVVKKFSNDPAFKDAKFHIVGQPQVNYTMDRSADEAGMIFMPIFFILAVSLLILLYRSLRAVVATILALAFAVVFTLGVMSAIGIPLSMITTLLPVALFLILFAGIIHLLNGFFDPSADRNEQVNERILRVFTMKWTASLMAVATTMVGFGSLLFSEVEPVKQLGGFMALGMFVGLATNYSLFPALLSLMFKTVPRPKREKREYRTQRLVLALFDYTQQFKVPIVVGSTALAIACVSTLFNMEFETNPINYLDPNDPAKKDLLWFEKNITGTATLELMFVTDKPGAFYDPAQILWLAKLRERIEKIPDVKAAVDLSALLKEAKGMMWGFFETPKDEKEVAFYINQIRNTFPEFLSGFVTKDGKAVRMTIVTNSLDYIGFDRIKRAVFRELNRLKQQTPPKYDFKLIPTGQTDLLTAITVYLSRTLIYSFLTTVLGVTLLIFLTFRSVSLTLLAMLQNLFGIALMFGLMFVVGIKQSIPTIIIASIVLGIEVDNTIHLLYHAKEARRRGLDFLSAMKESLRITGRAIVVTNGIISIGFMVFLLSGFPPIRHFGLLIASAMAFATGGVLIFLPAALGIFARNLGLSPSELKEAIPNGVEP